MIFTKEKTTISFIVNSNLPKYCIWLVCVVHRISLFLTLLGGILNKGIYHISCGPKVEELFSSTNSVKKLQHVLIR